MSTDPRMLASDEDRERTAALLREHHAVGRLTPEEFDDRLNRVFAARTHGELDALLADLPAIDLYQLPAAGIRPAGSGAMRSRRKNSPATGQRGDSALVPRRIPSWLAWTAASSLLLALWLGAGIAVGGAAWFPWFLLIVIPWALIIVRRSRGNR